MMTTNLPNNCPNRFSIAARRIALHSWFLAMISSCLGLVGSSQETEQVDAPGKGSQVRGKEPKGLTKYMGRRIALPMSYHGIPWLNRAERADEERPQEMLEQLQIQPGMTVCDMGCGDGFYTVQLARLVGPQGKVLAVDIQPEMLQALGKRCEQERIDNVEIIQGKTYDPRLPKEAIDLILMVDVYHEFSHPVEMLAAMRQALKPTGAIALVEFRAEDPTVPILPEHKMTRKQILKEYQANGFKVGRDYEKLPWQRILFMEKDDEK